MDPVVIILTPVPPTPLRLDVTFQLKDITGMPVPLVTVMANQAPEVGQDATPPEVVVSDMSGPSGVVTLSLLRGKTYWCSTSGMGWLAASSTVNVPA